MPELTKAILIKWTAADHAALRLEAARDHSPVTQFIRRIVLRAITQRRVRRAKSAAA